MVELEFLRLFLEVEESVNKKDVMDVRFVLFEIRKGIK